MIYFLITTSIYNNCKIRENQYINGISRAKKLLSDVKNLKIIIIENNGFRKTFLDDDSEVFYTRNNFLNNEKGYKELKDILDCIKHYQIKDDDLVVKMTGRYIIDDNSQFINVLKKSREYYDCIIKFGAFYSPIDFPSPDCITGLIAMKAKFIKKIGFPLENEVIEHKWASIANKIEPKKIYAIRGKIGIQMCPGGNFYRSY